MLWRIAGTEDENIGKLSNKMPSSWKMIFFSCMFPQSDMFCDITLNERNKHITKYHLGIPVFIFKLFVVELVG